MPNSRSIAVVLLVMMLSTAGCYTAWEGKEPKRSYRENEGSFADLAARNAYIEKRADELMRRGLSREEAASHAASDWFSNAPVASQSPTRKELERRTAEANFADYARKAKKDSDNN